MKFLLVIPLLTVCLTGIAEAVDKMPVVFPYYNYLKSVTTIIVVLFLLMLLVKKLIPVSRFESKNKDLVQVLDRIQLEPTVSLYLVRMKEKVWLLSVGNKNTQVIDNVSELIQPDDYQLRAANFSFQDILDRVTKKNEQ